MTRPMLAIIADVLAEVDRVDGIRGDDAATPDGTGLRWSFDAEEAKEDYDASERCGRATFALALREECYEALAESDRAKLRAELVQIASVAMRWIRAIDARP